ncbi:MAG: hypothetical protein P8Z31_05460, partial [Gammaproteobacteria bacterium]
MVIIYHGQVGAGSGFVEISEIYLRIGEIDEAIKVVNQSLEYGLPFARYLAGPRDILKSLVESEQFKKIAYRGFDTRNTSGLIRKCSVVNHI